MAAFLTQQEQQQEYPAAAAEVCAIYPAGISGKIGKQQRVRSGSLAGKKIPVHTHIIK